MNLYGSQSRYWTSVVQRFVVDAAIVVIGFYGASVFRFSDWTPTKFITYLPSVLVAAVLLPSTIYVFGLYAQESMHYSRSRRMGLLLLACGAMVLSALAYGSLDFSSRVGRGVLAVAAVVSSVVVLIHHTILLIHARRNPDRLALLVLNEADAEEARRLMSAAKPHVRFIGVIAAGDREAAQFTDLPVVDKLENLSAERCARTMDSLICSPEHFGVSQVADCLRRLRYQGVHIMTMIDAFEDLYQLVPLELVDGRWLLQASSTPRMIYIRKVKRAFDIIVAALLLVLLGLPCLVAMLLVRLTSKGPVLFRQQRCGRMGRPFTLLKLRTMRVDAEAAGPQWSTARDPRVTPLGRLLRKYRVDEVPQLINILRGEMSFVGPRPERPEFVTDLEKQIPYYGERFLLQPGLTGWAQVCYPYGSTVEDARRKLEYDLYYTKHMSLGLDVFILLDTVRTVLRGVSWEPSRNAQDSTAARPVMTAVPDQPSA